MTFTFVTLLRKPTLKEIQKNRTEQKDNDKTRIPKPLDVQRESDCYSWSVKIAPDETHQVFRDTRERYRELILRRDSGGGHRRDLENRRGILPLILNERHRSGVIAV